MTLNEIQEVIEGRIQLTGHLTTTTGEVPGSAQQTPRGSGASHPAGTAAGVHHSTFELDPTHMVHK